MILSTLRINDCPCPCVGIRCDSERVSGSRQVAGCSIRHPGGRTGRKGTVLGRPRTRLGTKHVTLLCDGCGAPLSAADQEGNTVSAGVQRVPTPTHGSGQAQGHRCESMQTAFPVGQGAHAISHALRDHGDECLEGP